MLIPKFSSPGLKKRLVKAGFSNVIEVGSSVRLNKIDFNTFVHHDISHDDAIFSIRTRDAYVIHSNDNWRYTEHNISRMKEESAGRKILLATQVSIANGWPYLYEAYTKKEKIELANNRLIHIMNEVYRGAIKIGVNYFFHYAGHSMAYVKGNEELRELGGFRPLSFYKDNIDAELFKQIEFLDMLPGCCFDFETEEVYSPFNAFSYDEGSLKRMSAQFYDKHKTYEKTDSYIHSAPLFSLERRAILLRAFLHGFNKYVESAIERSGYYQNDIIGSIIKIVDADGVSESVKVGEGLVVLNDSHEADTTFSVLPSVLDALLAKKIIWENLDIGFQSRIRKKSHSYHNGHITRWLSRYGYLYYNSK